MGPTKSKPILQRSNSYNNINLLKNSQSSESSNDSFVFTNDKNIVILLPEKYKDKVKLVFF